MRAVDAKISERDANLVLIGSGSIAEAGQFLEDTDTRARLLVDPALGGYRAAQLGRRLLAPYSPRSWWEGFRLFRRGYRPGPTQGDEYQLGGLFVITPEQEVAYSFVSRAIYQQAPIAQVVDTLDRLGGATPGGSD